MKDYLSIFYGDEIGMEGIGNLANRKPFTWNHMDKKLLYFFRKMGLIRQKEQFLTEADLKSVSRDGYFYRKFSPDLAPAEKKIAGYIDNIQKTAIHLPKALRILGN